MAAPPQTRLQSSVSSVVGTSTYGPLVLSNFQAHRAELPAGVDLPASVAEAIAVQLPPEHDFSLELDVAEQWNRLQNRKYSEQAAQAKLEEAEREAKAKDDATRAAVQAAEEEGRRIAEEKAELAKLEELGAKMDGLLTSPAVAVAKATPPANPPPSYSSANPFNEAPAEAKGSDQAAIAPEHAPKLDQMLSLTGATADVCIRYLQTANFDLDLAVNSYWDAQS